MSRSIERHPPEWKYRGFTTKCKPLFTHKNKKCRLDFARKYLSTTLKKKQRTKKHKVKCLQMNARLIFVRMLKRGKFGDGEKQLMIRCISHLSNMVEAVLCHELPVFIDDLTAVRRSRENF